MITFIINVRFHPAYCIDFHDGQIKVFEIFTGIAISHPEFVEFFARFFGRSYILGEFLKIIRHVFLFGNLAGDHVFLTPI